MLAMALNSVWNFVFSSASLGTIVGCIAVAVAVFSGNIIVKFAIPDLRKWAIFVAVIAFGYTAVLGKGYVHGLAVKQAQWDASLNKEADDGAKILRDALRDGASDTPDSLRNDRWNRDNWKERSGD